MNLLFAPALTGAASVLLLVLIARIVLSTFRDYAGQEDGPLTENWEEWTGTPLAPGPEASAPMLMTPAAHTQSAAQTA